VRVEKRKVRAPEIGRVWLNCSALSFRQLRGPVVLVDLGLYQRQLHPYTADVQAWHEGYKDKGLTAIGFHAPEFTFAQSQPDLERGSSRIRPDLSDGGGEQSRNREGVREPRLAYRASDES
jgi:hypothetical protein